MFFVRRHGFFVLVLGLALLPGRALRAQSTAPALTQPLPAQTLSPGGNAFTLDLKNYFGLPGVTGQIAQVDTVLGKFNLELFASDTPQTVSNFLAYINAGRYANTIVHRSVANFVIQMGGYTAAVPPVHIPTFAAVQNEFKRSNVRGTVAMAKLGGDPNSATSEWFVNLGDNRHSINPITGVDEGLDVQNGGFTVFARVLGNGMSVVDAIAAVQVFDGSGGDPNSPFKTVPLRDVRQGQQNIELANLIVINNVTTIPVYPATTGATAVLQFSASSSNSAVVTAAVSGTTLTLTPAAAGSANVTVTATDTNGTTATGTIVVTVGFLTAAPTITFQPQSRIVMASGTASTVVFTVTATGAPAPTYQWQRNGRDVTGQTTATYVLTNAADAQAGTFTCVVSNSGGSVTTQSAVLSFAPAPNPARLANLSIFTNLAAGETMALGTVVGGANTTGVKPLLVRAAGPALTQLGITGVLPDPKITLNYTTPTPTVAVATNDDWGGDAGLIAAFNAVGAFPYATADSKDAAIFRGGANALASGKYTVQVSDAAGAAGSVIAEFYDSTPGATFAAATPRLINVSVLKQIATGATLTTGFYVGGTTAKTVLVRAMGPSLAQFGVTDTMSDPQLALFNSRSAKIAENDNWGGDLQLATAGGNVGAFAPTGVASKDAILLLTLPPGSYTAQASANGAGGRALVEVYEVP